MTTHLLRSPYTYGLDALSRTDIAATNNRNSGIAGANASCFNAASPATHPSASAPASATSDDVANTGTTATAQSSAAAAATAVAAPTHQMPATMNCLLVRVETDTGLIGWGDGSSFETPLIASPQPEVVFLCGFLPDRFFLLFRLLIQYFLNTSAFGFALTATTRHVLDTLIAPATIGTSSARKSIHFS